MNLPDESNVTLKGVKYQLRKTKPQEGNEGYILTVDEPDKSAESNFLSRDLLKALHLLTANTTVI
jgi:hypothetical protein